MVVYVRAREGLKVRVRVRLATSLFCGRIVSRWWSNSFFGGGRFVFGSLSNRPFWLGSRSSCWSPALELTDTHTEYSRDTESAVDQGK